MRPDGRQRLNVLGIDVGGTKVAVARIEGGAVREGVERPTPLESGEALLECIERAVDELASGSERPAAVGVGVPSQIDFRSGTVLASVNIPLAGVPLRDELGRRLGVPVYVDNDANVAALGEAEAAGVRNLVMLTLGTGVGGGIVTDGRVFRGATGLGAELGHVVIHGDGQPCFGTCPNRGCLEAHCSGQALERAASERAGRRLTGREVVAAAQEGDGDALALLQELGRNLGIGIASIVNAFEPEQVVIGGGLSRAAALFVDRAREEAASRALPALFANTSIHVARAGAEAGVIGAGVLAAQELARAGGDTAPATTPERAL